MLFSTPTQFAVCGLLLVAGWLFGLASHPGGRKWKERYLAEREAHADNRKTWDSAEKTLTERADERNMLAKTEYDARETEHRDRIAELERENAQLRTETPVGAGPIGSRAQTAARPADAYRANRGWFDFGRKG